MKKRNIELIFEKRATEKNGQISRKVNEGGGAKYRNFNLFL